MRIIDAHNHIFPDKIARKACESIGRFYNIVMSQPEATVENLIRQGSRAGVERYLVCSSATNPDQVVSINNYILEQCALHPEFLGLATVHPGMENPQSELERVKKAGLKGLKLHPDFASISIDDPGMYGIYEYCAENGLPILFHTGDERYDYSHPRRLGRVMDDIPGLVCIAAHFGGYSVWDEVPKYLRRPNVYFDTSSTLFKLPKEDCLELMELLGYDRFMFGTDYPMWDHSEELQRFMALGLGERENRMILAENFIRLFGLE